MAKNNNKKRHIIQIAWAVITNSYVTGFLYGKIYQGKLKKICVPGLNCHSCPGALGTCPLGALQNMIGSSSFRISFYIIGFFMVIGAICGRFICGWLCPFGLIQDLIHKIPFPKKLRTFKGDRILRCLKYVILLMFVIILPMLMLGMLGYSEPFFCKLICPAGTLEAGIPLVILNKSLSAILGWLYVHKITILVIILILSVIIYRPFCKYICPLGAIYSVFNPISFLKIRIDDTKCIKCGKCSNVCKMGVDVLKHPNSLECIRCGDCKKVCDNKAITYKIK